MSNNLLFFNKEGYPHNFSYNSDTESYEGKILFDENSDQTFKTQSLHIFEDVSPIDFGLQADLISLNYNNNSGLTIAGQVFFSEEITNISKVNESNEFYSKWIYGDGFHKKFPAGTVIKFSNVIGTPTGVTDFSNDQYFTVLSVKKNAFLILTNTRNDLFNFNFISGLVYSVSMISINDYNRVLSGTPFFQNLYTNKKFSIINSEYNDNIVSIKQSGTSVSYLNDIRLNGIDGQYFTLTTKFFDERPKILQGNAVLSSNKYLELGKFAYLLAPDIEYIGGAATLIKKEIIFQDYSGGTLFSGFTFVVDSVIDSRYAGTKKLTFKKYYQIANSYKYQSSTRRDTTQWNSIQYDGFLNIRQGDIIRLSGLTGSILMNNREFSVSSVAFNDKINKTTILTPGYIINETGSTYSITVKLQPYQITKVEVTPSGNVSAFNNVLVKDAYCYSTSTTLDFTQIYTSGVSHTIDAFINKFKPALYQYGIDAYHTYKNSSDYLSIESLYGAKTNYFDVSGFTNGVKIPDDFTFSNNGLTTKYDIITNEQLYDEKTNREDSNLYKTQVSSEVVFYLHNDNDKFGFRLTLNGNQYYIKFNTDTQTTINDFVTTYETIFYNNGFIINSGYSNQYTGYTLQITTDVDIWDLEVMVNILSSYQIIKQQRNTAILLSGNEIRSLGASLFDIGLATGMIIKITGSSYNENNKEYNIISLTDDVIGLSYQGVFTSESNILVIGKSREYIRKPRGEFNRDVYLRAYWEIPSDDTIDDTIFFYDISGDQLQPYNNNPDLTYAGKKPLIDPLQNNVVFLNTTPNKELSRVTNPKYQQTVFDELIFKLEQLDSSASYNWIPEPLEIFIGYNSPNEGVNTRTLKIERIDKLENTNVIFSYSGYTNSGSSSAIPNFIFHDNILEHKSFDDFNFLSYGFEKDQLIKFYFKDQSKSNQRIFENTNTYKILDLSRNKIWFDTGYTASYSGDTGFTYFTTTGTTFFFKIEVQPKKVLTCPIYGQTEIEDIRYKVNLNNVGVQLEDDTYQIVYQSDIQDNAIDYTLFNQKRKEMLTTFREIYDYIGSYKSLINAINYFGYNDLHLYEYYRNIDQNSVLYGKLHKVLIPDIFDNTVEGWNEMDFIQGKYQNQNTWKKTNLFNLAYRVTDEDGNNVLMYTLEEVQYKLGKLKNWLRKNIIPISANLLDITGVADTNFTHYQDYDESNQTKKSVVDRNSTVVNFNYTATLNFGSDYLVTVNFYILSGATGTTIDYNEVPQSFSAKIKTFYLSGDTMIPVQYYKILKNDLEPFSFNLDKYIDPYIYIETTAYDNDGSGLGYVNNKMFYFDEPRNFWLVNHNFDMTKFKYYQTTEFINNTPSRITTEDIVYDSTVVSSSVETIVKVNTMNKTYLSKIPTNNSTL
jgi:hypothetical protein